MNSFLRQQVNNIFRYWTIAAAFNAFLLGMVAVTGMAAAEGRPVILALGDSLTAGYGLAPGMGFPEQLEAALHAAGTDARVINAGVSGDTSAGGLARLDWLLADRPNLVVVELGANDGLRGLSPAATRDNLDRILGRIRQQGAHVLLAGMVAPPNLGPDYGKDFNSIYPELAQKHGTAFYPFFLDGVAMDPALNLGDGIHPNAEGIAVIVEKMLPVVREALAEAAR